jgi:hypothetical protein
LYFLPLPHGHGSFRPTFGSSRFTVLITSSPPVRAGRGPGPLGIGSSAIAIAAPERDAANAGDVSAFGLFMMIGVARRARGAAGASSFNTGRSQNR